MENYKKNDIFSHSQRIITLNESVEKLLSVGHSISLPANTVFIQAGDQLDVCYVLQSGIVVGCESYPNGMIREGLIMVPNSLVGEAFVLLNEPSPITFKTILPTRLICISRDELLHKMKEDSSFSNIIMESLAKKFLSSMDEVRQMASYNVTWRICNLLQIFACHYGEEIDGKIRISISLSQQAISQLLCVNRITTVRIIKRLKDLHLLEQENGYYFIVNLEALIDYQQNNSTSNSNC